jgi:two-component system cell cycle sensor histidine kinase/response regulator CckA
MLGDANSGSRTPSNPAGTLVRLFGARPARVLDDLATRSDAAMRLLFDTAESGLLLVDSAGRIARANAALRRLLAAEVDLVPGAAAALIFVAEDRAAAWETLHALLSERLADSGITARLRWADPGPERGTEIGCRPIHEDDGAVSGVLMRFADVTARVRLETQLARSREIETVGHLAGGIAHDFNNLLTAILGAVESAQDRDPDPATGTDLEQIRHSAERGAALVRNLLALGRQQYLQAAPVAVNAALEAFATMIRPVLGGNIVLDLALERPGRRVLADATQLERVLMNLAINARHAMPHGGTLTLRSGHETLYRKRAEGRETIQPGRYVTIAVQDTGIGIPPDLLERIFEPFFTTRRAEGGSGLGLATAHGIVRQSGGHLTVESEVGVGTTFRIYLPRAQETAAQPDQAGLPSPPPRPAEAAAPNRARRVMLVDDENAVRRITARALTRHGWTVLEAESAEAALQTLDADPAIVLTALISDVVMPGLDGVGLVDAVRARYPAIPAILVSGYAENFLGNLTAAGVAFIGKPYTPKALVAKLDDLAPADAPCLARQKQPA